MPYELLEDHDEGFDLSSIPQEAGRHAGRTASNIGTLAVGLPGDLFSLVNEYIANPAYEAVSGKKGSKYEETPLGKLLPTTETHRKNLEPLTGEYLKPQNKVEKFVDDVVEDASLIFNPGKAIPKGVKAGTKAFKSLAKSIGANFLGETVTQVSEDKTAGDLTKLGSLFVLSVIDQESAAKQIGKLYRTAESNLPANAAGNATRLESSLNSLENSITKKRPVTNLAPQEKFVIDQIDKVKNLIDNGSISIEQAIAQKRSLSKELATLYREVPKLGDQKNVKNLAKQITGHLNSVIQEYGKKNPKFYKPYKEADNAFGTLANSNWVSSWIDKNVVQSPVTTGLMHLFGPVSVTAATAAVPYQAAKLMYRITKSPTLAKIYGNTLKSASKEDAKAFNKYLKQLDEEIQNEESQDKYEFID